MSGQRLQHDSAYIDVTLQTIHSRYMEYLTRAAAKPEIQP